MLNKKSLLCCLALSSLLGLALAADEKCRECMPNSGYCIDDTSYYICPDGVKPSTSSGPIKCKASTFCTADPTGICKETGTRPCQDSGSCGKCGASAGLICIGRSEYAYCQEANDANPIRGSCEAGQVCSMQLYESTEDNPPRKICAPESILEFLGYQITCDGPASPPSTTTTTTIPPDDLKTECESKEATANPNNARSFYIHNPDDSECYTYIYCEKTNNVMIGVLFTCPNSGHWNVDTRKCQQTKPQNCPA